MPYGIVLSEILIYGNHVKQQIVNFLLWFWFLSPTRICGKLGKHATRFFENIFSNPLRSPAVYKSRNYT